MKKNILIGLGTVAVAVALGTIQASGQASYTFNFADNTSDGWANSGFGNTPQASVVTIGSEKYISILNVGYQSANVSSSDQLGGGTYAQDPYTPIAISDAFNNAMYAAINNPVGSYVQYDYYIDTSTWITPGTFLQVASLINPESGYYGSTGTPSAYEPNLNGTQTASGGVFSGTVTVPFTAYGVDAGAASEVGFRLGLIVNTDATGAIVNFGNITIYGVPEPASLALCGMGLLGGLLALRRRNS